VGVAPGSRLRPWGEKVFERFTPQARQVVVHAQEEARGLRHNYIGTEHMLLGLLREPEDLPGKALGSLGVTYDGTRERVLEIVGAGEEPSSGQNPFTPRAKKVLELSLREALSIGDDHVGSEHILLGLADETDGVASRVLNESGASPEAVRQTVLRLLSERPPRPEPQVAPTISVRPRRWIGLSWLAPLTPLLERVAADIRHELGRDPDSGDLLLVLACVQQPLAGRALSALGVDLDQLWATIERLRAQTLAEQHEHRQQIDETAEAKQAALEAQDFGRAAALRDRERELRERERQRATVDTPAALEAVRRRLGLPTSGEPPRPEPDDG
jgi:ATP-dependent Clp protease ATP-binding subunit ClpA